MEKRSIELKVILNLKRLYNRLNKLVIPRQAIVVGRKSQCPMLFRIETRGKFNNRCCIPKK